MDQDLGGLSGTDDETRRAGGASGAAALWDALRSGELRVLELRPDGAAPTVIPNPPDLRGARRLGPVESVALERLARGAQAKAVAVELGLSPSRLSQVLAAGAARLGFRTTFEALRGLGRLLASPGEVPLEGLTSAEREVLRLVQRGHSNRAIAAIRERSERTIANQVSSLLRKTGLPGRRALAACLAPQQGQGEV